MKKAIIGGGVTMAIFVISACNSEQSPHEREPAKSWEGLRNQFEGTRQSKRALVSSAPTSSSSKPPSDKENGKKDGMVVSADQLIDEVLRRENVGRSNRWANRLPNRFDAFPKTESGDDPMTKGQDGKPKARRRIEVQAGPHAGEVWALTADHQLLVNGRAMRSGVAHIHFDRRGNFYYEKVNGDRGMKTVSGPWRSLKEWLEVQTAPLAGQVWAVTKGQQLLADGEVEANSVADIHFDSAGNYYIEDGKGNRRMNPVGGPRRSLRKWIEVQTGPAAGQVWALTKDHQVLVNGKAQWSSVTDIHFDGVGNCYFQDAQGRRCMKTGNRAGRLGPRLKKWIEPPAGPPRILSGKPLGKQSGGIVWAVSVDHQLLSNGQVLSSHLTRDIIGARDSVYALRADGKLIQRHYSGGSSPWATGVKAIAQSETPIQFYRLDATGDLYLCYTSGPNEQERIGTGYRSILTSPAGLLALRRNGRVQRYNGRWTDTPFPTPGGVVAEWAKAADGAIFALDDSGKLKRWRPDETVWDDVADGVQRLAQQNGALDLYRHDGKVLRYDVSSKTWRRIGGLKRSQESLLPDAALQLLARAKGASSGVRAITKDHSGELLAWFDDNTVRDRNLSIVAENVQQFEVDCHGGIYVNINNVNLSQWRDKQFVPLRTGLRAIAMAYSGELLAWFDDDTVRDRNLSIVGKDVWQFVVDCHGEIYANVKNINLSRWRGDGFTPLRTGVRAIARAYNGKLLAWFDDNTVRDRNLSIVGQDVCQFVVAVKEMAILNDQLFTLRVDGSGHRYAGDVENPWEHIVGAPNRLHSGIGVSDGELITLRRNDGGPESGVLYRWTRTSHQSHEWRPIGQPEGSLGVAMVQHGDDVFVLGDNGGVYRYTGASESPWEHIVGTPRGRHISLVSAHGELLSLRPSDGKLFRRLGSAQAWAPVDSPGSGPISALIEHRGDALVLRNGVVYQFRHDGWTRIGVDKSVDLQKRPLGESVRLVQNGAGDIYLRTVENTLHKWTQGEFGDSLRGGVADILITRRGDLLIWTETADVTSNSDHIHKLVDLQRRPLGEGLQLVRNRVVDIYLRTVENTIHKWEGDGFGENLLKRSPKTTIKDYAVSENGKIYVLSGSGEFWCQMPGGAWYDFPMPADGESFTTHGEVLFLTRGNGVIELVMMSATAWTTIKDYALSEDGNAYVLSFGGEFWRQKKNGSRHKYSMPADGVQLAQNGAGDIYLRTVENTIHKWEGDGFGENLLKRSPKTTIKDYAVSENGRVYVLSGGGEFWCQKPDGSWFDYQMPADGESFTTHGEALFLTRGNGYIELVTMSTNQWRTIKGYAVSEDGKVYVLRSGGEFWWQKKDGSRHKYPMPADGVQLVQNRAGDIYLRTVEDTIHKWEGDRFSPHRTSLRAIARAQNGELLAWFDDNTVRDWNLSIVAENVQKFEVDRHLDIYAITQAEVRLWNGRKFDSIESNLKSVAFAKTNDLFILSQDQVLHRLEDGVRQSFDDSKVSDLIKDRHGYVYRVRVGVDAVDYWKDGAFEPIEVGVKSVAFTESKDLFIVDRNGALHRLEGADGAQYKGSQATLITDPYGQVYRARQHSHSPGKNYVDRWSGSGFDHLFIVEQDATLEQLENGGILTDRNGDVFRIGQSQDSSDFRVEHWNGSEFTVHPQSNVKHFAFTVTKDLLVVDQDNVLHRLAGNHVGLTFDGTTVSRLFTDRNGEVYLRTVQNTLHKWTEGKFGDSLFERVADILITRKGDLLIWTETADVTSNGDHIHKLMDLQRRPLGEGVQLVHDRVGNIYLRSVLGSTYQFSFTTGKWFHIGGGPSGPFTHLVQLAGKLYALRGDGRAFVYNGNPTSWDHIGGEPSNPFTNLTQLGGKLYTLRADGQPFVYNGTAGNWTHIAGDVAKAHKELVQAGGKLYTLRADGQAFVYNGTAGNWTHIAGDAANRIQHLTKQGDSIYILNHNGSVLRYDVSSKTWRRIGGPNLNKEDASPQDADANLDDKIKAAIEAAQEAGALPPAEANDG